MDVELKVERNLLFPKWLLVVMFITEIETLTEVTTVAQAETLHHLHN